MIGSIYGETSSGIYGVLPHLNACLNATSFLLVTSGLLAIKLGKERVHQRLMLSAVTTSALFLISYVLYHLEVGSVHFQGKGTIRTVYFTILISHTILAVVSVPLIVTTVVLGLKRRLAKHKKIARITAPIWLYVSLTGVIVYWMLYQAG